MILHTCPTCERQWRPVDGESESDCPWCNATRWMQFAKTARNAWNDLFACIQEGGRRGRPMDIMRADDWKRAKNWSAEIEKHKTAIAKVQP